MFRNRDFNLAFLISLSWHLFFMFFVVIVVLPTGFEMAKTTTISFLGPILERTAFDLMLDKKMSQRGTFFEQPRYSKGDFTTYTAAQGEKIRFDSLFFGVQTRESETRARALLGNFKIVPPPQEDDGAAPQEKRAPVPRDREGPKDFLIEGPPAGREILSLPEAPLIQKRLEEGQGAFTVELKFEVLPEGGVNEVSLLISSGYPDIDLAAMNYIKAFKFSPVNQGAGKKSAWGKIRLNLKTQ